MVKLSIVIVNYNVRFFLEQALLSVRKAVKNIDAEIFVVDNNSADGSVEMLKKFFGEIKLIENKINTGFAVANNQAIKQATGEYILLLNPDTVVEEDTFEKCIQFMDAHADAGALGVKMVDGKGKFLPESKRGFPSPAVAFYKAFGLSKLFPKSKTFGRYHLGHLSENETHAVEVLAGAFMLIRKTVLDKIGLLDESFFMYGEDIDLSYRIIQAGYQNYYYPHTRIIHYKGESTKKGSLNYVRLFYNAMILFAQKHFSNGKAGWLIFFIKIAVYFRAALSVAKRLLSVIALPVTDAALIFYAMLLLKNYWEENVKVTEGLTFPQAYLQMVVPGYIFIWLTSVFLNGGYDKPLKASKLVRGILVGTLIISAVYAFLPEAFRFSRAMILLGAVVAIVVLYLVRLIFVFLQTGKNAFAQSEKKRLIIVGDEIEGLRVLRIVKTASLPIEFIGFVSDEKKFSDHQQWLGHIEKLSQLQQIYKADEIIFCSADIASQKIIDLMTEIGSAVDYKIVAQESIGIIGSNSKDLPGELYTIDVKMNIATAAGRRNKRVFDLLVCGFAFPFLPLLIWFTKHPFRFLANWFLVFAGNKTWVGYANKKTAHSLPRIKDCVFTPVDELKKKTVDDATAQRLNLLYAKNYSSSTDFSILWKAWRQI